MITIKIFPVDSLILFPMNTEKVIALLDEKCSFYLPNFRNHPSYKLYVRTDGEHGWDGKRHLFRKTSKGYVVFTGLVPFIQELLKKRGIVCRVINKFTLLNPTFPRMIAEKVKLNDITFRDYQLDGIEQALIHQRGVVHVATNGGKTAIMGGIIKAFKIPKTLILVHSAKLARQLKDKLQYFLDEPIGMIGSGFFDHNAQIIIGMPGSLKITKKKDKEKVFILNNLFKSVRLICIDEVHHVASKQFEEVLKHCKYAYSRFGFSGTPFSRSDGKNILVEALVGPQIIRVTNKQLIDRGISAKPIVFFHSLKNNKEVKDREWITVYKKGIVHNAVRNQLIVSLAVKAAEEGKSVFISVFEISHGTNLKNLLATQTSVPCVFIHGTQDPYKQDQLQKSFEKGDVPILIGSPVLGEGIDFDAAVDCLIVADAKKAPINLVQKVGRVLRKGGRILSVHDFVDNNHKYLKKHSTERLMIYKKEKFDVNMV